ncbi:hypothetical protein JB92DRAFT_2835266 [Gautieria morchelliformis]|nr:hypothetical protein JB92DRAFT_2835266 [Gautieria morchelliformis]
MSCARMMRVPQLGIFYAEGLGSVSCMLGGLDTWGVHVGTDRGLLLVWKWAWDSHCGTLIWHAILHAHGPHTLVGNNREFLVKKAARISAIPTVPDWLPDGKGLWQCQACQDAWWRTGPQAHVHEDTQGHRRNVHAAPSGHSDSAPAMWTLLQGDDIPEPDNDGWEDDLGRALDQYLSLRDVPAEQASDDSEAERSQAGNKLQICQHKVDTAAANRQHRENMNPGIHGRIKWSVFSRQQVDIFLWMLKVNGIDDVPLGKSMKALNASMQHVCGIQSIKYNGALGHTYYVNNLVQIIGQDSYPHLSKARQGQRWLKDVDDALLTPMDRMVVMPFRWYTRDQVVCVKAWRPHAWQGVWVILQYEVVTVAEGDLLLNFVEGHGRYGCLSWWHIGGAFQTPMAEREPWTQTDPKVTCLKNGTSTPAGLEREHAQKEYNVHFFCTSNTALLLEMLEGIVVQLRYGMPKTGQGIWAWDCVYGGMVLILVWIFALLGDNPVQSLDANPDGGMVMVWEGSRSEHVGGGQDIPVESSEPGSSAGERSEGGMGGAPAPRVRRQKGVESMAEMVDCLKRFMMVGQLEGYVMGLLMG